MPRFCMGAGVAMGTTGLKWPGADGDDDCVMLWAGALGVTSAARTAVTCIGVFCIAVLAQYLTTSNGSRVQEAKARAKQLYAAAQNPLARMEQGVGRYAITELTEPPKLQRKCSSPEHECKHTRREADPTAEGVQMAAYWSEKLPASLRPLSPKRSAVSTSLRASSSSSSASRPPPAAASPTLEIPKVSGWEHLADSALHGLRILLAYLLMLAAMTYDVALLASIVAGFSAGFFWFAQDTAKVPVSADPCCS